MDTLYLIETADTFKVNLTVLVTHNKDKLSYFCLESINK